MKKVFAFLVTGGLLYSGLAFAGLTLDGVSSSSSSGSSSTAGWTDGGTNVYVTTTTDNVGVGTTAPGQKLDIRGNARMLGTSALYFGNDTTAFAVPSANTSADINFYTNSTNLALTLKNSGNVGIGTSTVGGILEVKGAPALFNRTLSGSTGIQSAIQFGLVGNGSTAGTGPSILLFADNAAGTKSFMGRINGIWENAAAGSEASSLAFLVRQNSADTTAVKEAMRLLSNGNVGIGTTVPREVLEVVGTVRPTGYKSSDGTAGLTQTCASTVTAVTVKNGLITAITCP